MVMQEKVTTVFMLAISLLLLSACSRHGSSARNFHPASFKHTDRYFALDERGEYSLKIRLPAKSVLGKHPSLWAYDTVYSSQPHQTPRFEIHYYTYYDSAEDGYNSTLKKPYEVEKYVYRKKHINSDTMSCLGDIYITNGRYGSFKHFEAICEEREHQLRGTYRIALMAGYWKVLDLDSIEWDRFFEDIVRSMQVIHVPSKASEEQMPEISDPVEKDGRTKGGMTENEKEFDDDFDLGDL